MAQFQSGPNQNSRVSKSETFDPVGLLEGKGLNIDDLSFVLDPPHRTNLKSHSLRGEFKIIYNREEAASFLMFVQTGSSAEITANPTTQKGKGLGAIGYLYIGKYLYDNHGAI